MPTEVCETRTFTRKEFYEFVWSAPATKLSAELGCSDVMIGKICKAYEIPKPYPGYWAQLSNGKDPNTTLLSENSNPNLQSITFYKYPEVEATVNEPPRELQYDFDVREMLNKARQLGEVKVAKTLRNAHRLVVLTKEHIDQQKADERLPWNNRSYYNRSEKALTLCVSASNSSMGRALRIMDAIIKRIESAGGKVEVRKHKYKEHVTSTVVVIAGEDVSTIRLREKHNQVRTINENAKYHWDRNRTELVPSGLLCIDEGQSSYRGPILKDLQKSKIEDGLAGMIIGFIEKAGELRIQRREKEEQDRRNAEAAKIRREREEVIRRKKAELKEKQDIEQAKVDELINHANNWRNSQLVREYLDALCEVCKLPTGDVSIGSPLADYLRWGCEQADRIDPLRENPHSVLDEFVDDLNGDLKLKKPR